MVSHPDPEAQPRRALSWTQISMLSRCGVQYDYRYNQGLKCPPSVALIVGRATHVPVQRDLEAKMRDGNLLQDEEVKAIAADAFTQAWGEDGGVIFSPKERDAGEAATRGAALDKTVTLATLHHIQLAPELHPVGVEESWRIDLGDSGLQITGRLDVREAVPHGPDPGATYARVRDTKTAAKSPPKNAAETSEQLTLYGMAHRVMTGQDVESFALDHLVATKVPKVVTLETKRDESDYRRMLQRVDVAIQALDSGVFLPAHPDTWWCSQRFCGYWDRCAFGGFGRTRTETLPDEEG